MGRERRGGRRKGAQHLQIVQRTHRASHALPSTRSGDGQMRTARTKIGMMGCDGVVVQLLVVIVIVALVLGREKVTGQVGLLGL